mgnify:CR=1 FL=1
MLRATALHLLLGGIQRFSTIDHPEALVACPALLVSTLFWPIRGLENGAHLNFFSDFWEAYLKVFPKETHRCVGKKSGETAHVERWYNTLRQRLARFVRKTLSFSKSDVYHHMVTKWFIAEYNLAISPTI